MPSFLSEAVAGTYEDDMSSEESSVRQQVSIQRPHVGKAALATVMAMLLGIVAVGAFSGGVPTSSAHSSAHLDHAISKWSARPFEWWDCRYSLYPGQTDCWAADVFQICHQKGYGANAQWAYDSVKGAGGNTKEAWHTYGEIVAADCKKAWDCKYSMYPRRRDCWAADVFQICHQKGNGANAEWAFHYVDGAGGDTKKAWQIHGKIVAHECNTRWGVQAWDCTHSLYPDEPNCWASDVFQRCHQTGNGANAGWAYHTIDSGAGENAKKAKQLYDDIVADDCKMTSEEPGVWLYSEPNGGGLSGGRFFVPLSSPFDICHRDGMAPPLDHAKFFLRDGVPSNIPLWDPERGSLVRSARVVGHCSALLHKSHCFECWDYGQAKKQEMLIGKFNMRDGIVNSGNGFDGLHHVEASGECGHNPAAALHF